MGLLGGHNVSELGDPMADSLNDRANDRSDQRKEDQRRPQSPFGEHATAPGEVDDQQTPECPDQAGACLSHKVRSGARFEGYIDHHVRPECLPSTLWPPMSARKPLTTVRPLVNLAECFSLR